MKIDASGKIYLNYNKVNYTLSYERYYHSDQIEKIRVFGKEKKIEIQSDRPSLRKIGSRKAVKWQILTNPMERPEMLNHPVFINKIFIYLQEDLDRLDGFKSDFNWKNHPKNAQ